MDNFSGNYPQVSFFFLQNFFKYLAKHSGYDAVNLTNAWNLQDTLFVEVTRAHVQDFIQKNLVHGRDHKSGTQNHVLGRGK